MLGARSPKVFLGLAALAGVCLLLGTLPILAALGLVPTSEPVEPVGRFVAFVFGAIFVALGALAVGAPLRSLARDHGARTWREATGLGLARFTGRVNRHSVVSALSVGALAAGYWSTLAGADLTLLGGAETMQGLVVIEFLIIHGFPFFVVGASFVHATRATARVIAWVSVVGLGIFYAVFAWVFSDGVWGVLLLVYLLIPNVLAFARVSPESGVRALAVSRWFIKFAVFVIIAAMTKSGDLAGPETLRLGAVYSTVLTFVELYRAVEIPLDLATEWGKAELRASQ